MWICYYEASDIFAKIHGINNNSAMDFPHHIGDYGIRGRNGARGLL